MSKTKTPRMPTLMLLRLAVLITLAPRNNFSFKCHRKDAVPANKDQSLVYAVNDITFHPVHGTFSTCGTHAIA